MGKVLRLEAARRARRAPAPPTTTVKGKKAQVVLFTGVRREYLPGHPLWDVARPVEEERDVPEMA